MSVTYGILKVNEFGERNHSWIPMYYKNKIYAKAMLRHLVDNAKHNEFYRLVEIPEYQKQEI